MPVQLLLDVDGSIQWIFGAPSPFDSSMLPELIQSQGFTTVDQTNHRVLVSSTDDETTALTALTLDGFDAATRSFRRVLILGALVILLLVATIVWLLTGTLTRPITRLTESATQIADGNLDADIAVATRSREVTALSNDLDRMLQRIRSTIDERERAAGDATQARDNMQRFLADMAHELRTPLTALKGYSDLYAGGILSETKDVDRAMSRIGSESDRLYVLVDNMLQLARNENQIEPHVPVDVAAIADQVAADLRAANPGRLIDLETAAGDHSVSGSPVQIHQAILNLAANAAKHTNPDTRIRVEVDSDAERIQVVVVDHGDGVDDEAKNRIFLPFFRTDESRSRSAKDGAGLGLALTHQIATQHDGDVHVEDTAGGGATFVLTLPR